MSETRPTLLTNTEAAEFLRISPRTLEHFRLCGTGPRFLKAGPGRRSRVLYDLTDLRLWIDKKYTSTSDF